MLSGPGLRSGDAVLAVAVRLQADDLVLAQGGAVLEQPVDVVDQRLGVFQGLLDVVPLPLQVSAFRPRCLGDLGLQFFQARRQLTVKPMRLYSSPGVDP